MHDPQVWYQIFAGVRERMYCDQPLLPRLDDRPINLRAEQRAGLAGQIVADHDHVDQIAHLVAETGGTNRARTSRSGPRGLRRTRAG